MSERNPGIGGEEHLQATNQPEPGRVARIGGGGITVYRPIIKFGEIDVLSAPSKPGRNLLLFGKSVPHTEGLAGPINQITNKLRKG